MKKIILSAAFVVAISGFAAAQSTSAKPATKQEKATVKKGAANTENKNTVLKQETSANAKSDSAVKLVLPPPNPFDTTAAMPKVKDKDF